MWLLRVQRSLLLVASLAVAGLGSAVAQAAAPTLAATMGQPQDETAGGATLQADSQVRRLDCAGRDAVVSGSRNTVTLTGSCTMLKIRGNNNVVTVALASGALVDIEGSGNRIRLSTQPGPSPRLRVVGADTDLAPLDGSSAPDAATAELAGEGQTITLDCKGGTATLAGTRNQITLTGGCRALTLRGEMSVVRASLAGSAPVLIEGNALSLIYTIQGDGPQPLITLRGMGSAAVRAGREAALALRDARTNAVVGTLPVLMRDLDATIVDAGTKVTLPPAVFTDVGLSAAGQLQLDRLVALLALTRPKGVRVITDAAGAQRAERVRGWLVSRGVKSVSVTTTAGPDMVVLVPR